MHLQETDPSTLERPLRLWPGVLIVSVQWLARFVLPLFVPDAMPIGVMASLACGLAIVIWWAFFSRAPRLERWGAIALMVVSMLATSFVVDESISTGMMGMLLPIYAIPGLSLVFVLWAVMSRRLSDGPRRATMVAAIVLSCAAWTLVRTGGFTGDGDSDFSWRWGQTAEDRLVAQAREEPKSRSMATLASETTIHWSGFRGPGRDSVVHGAQIETDWSMSPPAELWRRPVGPGWSSFAVHGDFFFTQEQRGEEEVVSCYKVSTGEAVWSHGDPVRFWESNAGAGPRGTPTLEGGRLYSLGATGLLNVLEARDGALVWSRDTASDTDTEIPMWGYSSSPLVLGDKVIVAASGKLAAYDLDAGSPLWFGPDGGASYSSPHRMTIDGVEQVLLLAATGIIAVDPADGRTLWEHTWKGYPIVQPAQTRGGDVLMSVSDKSGIRRITASREGAEWKVEERWTSIGLKPYFNDFVVHNGHAYGFDGRILSSIDLEDGERQWKGGRFGSGQLFLVADQDLLLVLSEKGEIALVGATPDGFEELARVPAIEGKTWNHPVLAGDVLLVRNAEEMAAFRLALEQG